MNYEPEDLLRPAERVPNLGLYPVVKYLANEEGIELTGRLTARPVEQASFAQERPALTRFLSSNKTGVIAARDASAFAKVIACTMKAFPKASTTVIGSKYRKLQNAADRVASFVDQGVRHKIDVVRAGEPYHYVGDQKHSGVIFSTFEETANLDFSQCDFVFFLNAVDCTHQVPQKLTLANPDHQFRLFGFRAPAKYSPYEEAVMMRTFGPNKLGVDHSLRIRRPIATKTYQFRCHRRKDAGMRELVGANRDRNRYITEFATSEQVGNRSVAILVNDIMQASKMSELLPSWEIYTSQNLNRTNGAFRNRVKRQCTHWKTGERSIVVLDESAHKFPGQNTDIAIWAGGSPKAPRIPNKWQFQDDDGIFRPLVVVDFEDSFGNSHKGRDGANQWSRWRRRQFEEQEIFSCVCQKEGAIRAFLKSLEQQKRKATACQAI